MLVFVVFYYNIILASKSLFLLINLLILLIFFLWKSFPLRARKFFILDINISLVGDLEILVILLMVLMSVIPSLILARLSLINRLNIKVIDINYLKK